MLDRAPHVEPLVADADAERWCVLLANRRNARFFVGDGGGLEETDRVEDDVHSQHDQGGWSQSRYQRGVEKEKDDHLVHVADVAFTAFQRQGFDRLLIGAPDELVGELEHKLHSYLRERIAGRLHLDVENSGIEDVRAATEKAIEDWTRRCEREALDRLTEGVGRGGRGAAGLAAVLEALNEQRVEILLVADGFRSPGGRDAETGMLHAGDHGPQDQELQRCENVVEHGDREGDRAVGEGDQGVAITTISARSAGSAPCCGTECASPCWERGSWVRRWAATWSRPAMRPRLEPHARAGGARSGRRDGPRHARRGVRRRRGRGDDALRRGRPSRRRWTAWSSATRCGRR